MALCKFRKVKYKLEKDLQDFFFFVFEWLLFHFKKVN